MAWHHMRRAILCLTNGVLTKRFLGVRQASQQELTIIQKLTYALLFTRPWGRSDGMACRAYLAGCCRRWHLSSTLPLASILTAAQHIGCAETHQANPHAHGRDCRRGGPIAPGRLIEEVPKLFMPAVRIRCSVAAWIRSTWRSNLDAPPRRRDKVGESAFIVVLRNPISNAAGVSLVRFWLTNGHTTLHGDQTGGRVPLSQPA